ncbi:MAG: hypothetical protein IJV64_10550 [Oscillospiraceae bacterium]|nr:hypothetical protein [Oscillospiraceae bacterium]
MLTKNLLFDAIGDMDDRFVMETDAALYPQVRVKPRRRLGRTLLLVAALSALFAATAYATHFFGLSSRVIPLPDERSETVAVLSPNDLQGTKTYEGTATWWRFVYEYTKEPPGVGDLSFTAGDDRYRSTCQLYWAKDETMAARLYAIAEEYGLTLYSDAVMATDEGRFYALSGVGDFAPGTENRVYWGYVFADGSFKAEGELTAGGERWGYTLHRFQSDALYPYGGSGQLRDFTEWTYTNAHGQELDLVLWQGGGGEVYYVTEDGQTFAQLSAPARERESLEALADALDFSALLTVSREPEERLRIRRGAEDNRDALARMTDFYESPVFQANVEFDAFFTANFYGASFTGVYGQAGYADIYAELARLSENTACARPPKSTVATASTRRPRSMITGPGLPPGGPGTAPMTPTISSTTSRPRPSTPVSTRWCPSRTMPGCGAIPPRTV